MTAEERARRFFDSYAFWLGLAYVGLAIVIVALYFVHQNYNKIEAEHLLLDKASRVVQVEQCYQKSANGPGTQHILAVMEDIVQDRIDTAQASLRLGGTTKMQALRLQSLYRAQVSLQDIIDIKAQAKEQTPTKQECAALADKLDVGRRNG